jgi:NAD(P)-dependent dehydrogenase (short-subunit alcohol dehydrogenase family)
MLMKNNVVLVTGGSRGIGRGIVRRICEEGGSVMFTGRNPDTGLALERECVEAGLPVKFIVADSASEADVKAAVEATIATFGGLNTLVHNAAATDMTGAGKPDSHVAEIDDATIDGIFGTAIKGAFYAAKYAIRHMRDHGGGAIINISASSSILAMKGRPAYQASKGAINVLTRQMAIDYGADNIRCNAIIVGFINTGSEGMERMIKSEGFKKGIGQQIVLGRPGAPRDIANGVVYLASEMGTYVTGILLPIEGGYTSHLNVGDMASSATFKVE